jgi:tRNA(fMet)-specific endonuclease VapC
VERFIARLEILAFDEPAGLHAADIKATLERTGRLIGAYDLLIAGHARSRGLTVVTGDLGEFKRVEGLRSEDWLAVEAP